MNEKIKGLPDEIFEEKYKPRIEQIFGKKTERNILEERIKQELGEELVRAYQEVGVTKPEDMKDHYDDGFTPQKLQRLKEAGITKY